MAVGTLKLERILYGQDHSTSRKEGIISKLMFNEEIIEDMYEL